MTSFSKVKVLGMFTALPLVGAAVTAVAEDTLDSRAGHRVEAVKRYEPNGTGSLSRGELRTGREAGPRLDTGGARMPSDAKRADQRDTRSDRRGRHRGQGRGSHFDTNGDGGITDEEEGAGYEQRELERGIMLQRYDADSDAR